MKEIRIDDIQISNDKPFVLIAGLNVLEEEKVILEVISKCKEDAEKFEIPYIFKASYDKANRSSHSSYRGPGVKKRISHTLGVKERF